MYVRIKATFFKIYMFYPYSILNESEPLWKMQKTQKIKITSKCYAMLKRFILLGLGFDFTLPIH